MEKASRVKTMDEIGIYKLPPECITQILSLASLQELCNLCQVSKKLKDDSEQDSLWNKFLPLNYKDLISEEILKQFPLKKKLFHMLCTGFIQLKGGDRTMSINKDTGEKTFMICSREVVFPDLEDIDFKFWRWVADDTSRFGEVVELVAPGFFTCLRVDTHILPPKTTYMAYMVFKHKGNKNTSKFYPESSSNVKIVEHDDSISTRRICLEVQGIEKPLNECGNFYCLGTRREDFGISGGAFMGNGLQFAVDRDDGWEEIYLGDLYNNEGENGVVQVSICQIGWNAESDRWMRGIRVEGVELRPKLNRSPN